MHRMLAHTNKNDWIRQNLAQHTSPLPVILQLLIKLFKTEEKQLVL